MDDLTAALQRVLAAGPRLRLAVLFGSVATGRATPSSDLDIAIQPADPALPLAAETALASELERMAGRSVDLVRLDYAPAVLRWQIASTGRLLLADQRSTWTQFRARTAAEHADIADAMDRYTRVFLRRLARPAR